MAKGGNIDPRTGRPWGDHGSAHLAIEYVLSPGVDLGCPAEDFLGRWREGCLDEWPEFYDWLLLQEKLNAPIVARQLKPVGSSKLPWED